jgi:putative transcriptional regulator
VTTTSLWAAASATKSDRRATRVPTLQRPARSAGIASRATGSTSEQRSVAHRCQIIRDTRAHQRKEQREQHPKWQPVPRCPNGIAPKPQLQPKIAYGCSHCHRDTAQNQDLAGPKRVLARYRRIASVGGPIETSPQLDALCGNAGSEQTKRDTGSEILDGLREIKRGDHGRVTKFPAVADVRQRSGLSQSQFARLLGVSVKTLQEWEQGRRAPSGAARTLISLAAKDPQALADVA